MDTSLVAGCAALGQPAAVRVWVSGARGFVGRLLLPALEAAGHQVMGVDREVEITEEEAVRRSIADARPDALVHLAAMSSPAAALQEPETAARINYLGTRFVLEATRSEAPAARVLLVTSGEVYGPGAPESEPWRESDPLNPATPYARSKAAADLLGARHADAGLDVVRVRPFNHTGPGQSTRFVLPSFAAQVAEIAAGRREPRLRVGNLDSVRDFLAVEDVIDAYLALLDPSVPAGVYNVASGEPRRIGALLEDLIELGDVECAVEVDPDLVRPTDWAVGDASRLRETTGWMPRRDWRDTLSRLLAGA